MFGDVFHHIVYAAEQGDDKIFCGHEVTLFADHLVTFSIRIPCDFLTLASLVKYYRPSEEERGASLGRFLHISS